MKKTNIELHAETSKKCIVEQLDTVQENQVDGHSGIEELDFDAFEENENIKIMDQRI